MEDRIMRIVELTDETKNNLLESLLKRSPNSYGQYEKTVNDIIGDVRARRDEALFEYTSKFDHCEMNAEKIRVTGEEIDEAYAQLEENFIEVMKHSKKICRHLHLPLQSGSTKILKAMNRRYTKEQYLELAEKIRREIPDMAITTDIIVGFPGETKEDVDETIDVIRRVKYDNAFTFIYSKRTGTPAAAMEQVPEEQVKEQFDRVLKTVQETAREQVSRYQGQIADVLVEEINENDRSMVTGRMSNNTLVHFQGDASLVGKIVNVSLDECHGFYYTGHQV